jgi:hypothetical protein
LIRLFPAFGDQAEPPLSGAFAQILFDAGDDAHQDAAVEQVPQFQAGRVWKEDTACFAAVFHEAPVR